MYIRNPHFEILAVYKYSKKKLSSKLNTRVMMTVFLYNKYS